MMFKRNLNDSLHLTNGNSKHAVVQNEEEPARIWRRFSVNEWTFSLSLFLFSLSVVLGKLCINYGNFLSWQTGNLPSATTFTHVYDTIGMSSMSILPKFDTKQLPANSEKFLNASNHYAEAAVNVLVTFYGKYWWLMRAAMSGLVTTGFTWFIIYNDSSIPGVNPPSPFSPSKQRIRKASRIQMSYLIGALNGILFFIYMCL